MKLAIRSDIGLANRLVTMSTVLALIGMRDVDYAASGAKVNCPFMDVFHPGSDRSFRVYDNQHAYCYACSERYDPVKIYSLANDISSDEAAEKLLDAVGYHEPDADERFEKAQAERYDIDRQALSTALITYCTRIDPEFETSQFDERTASALRQCLDLLPNVYTSAEAKEWLRVTKIAMARVLGVPA